MKHRNYTVEDFQRYDVVQWAGAYRKEIEQSPGLVAHKGELLAKDGGNRAVKATSTSMRVFPLFNRLIGADGAGWDSKASGTVTVIEGAHEADTLMFNTAGVFAINQELTAGPLTVDGKQMVGFVTAAAGNRVFAIVDEIPANNRGALRIRFLDHPYTRA